MTKLDDKLDSQTSTKLDHKINCNLFSNIVWYTCAYFQLKHGLTMKKLYWCGLTAFLSKLCFDFSKIIPNIFVSKNLTTPEDHVLNKLETSLSEEASIRVTAFLVRLYLRRGFLKISPCIFLCNKWCCLRFTQYKEFPYELEIRLFTPKL